MNISKENAEYWVPSKLIIRSDEFNLIKPNEKRIVFCKLYMQMHDEDTFVVRDSSLVEDVFSYLISERFLDDKVRAHLFNVFFEFDEKELSFTFTKMNEIQFINFRKSFNSINAHFNGVPLVLE